MNRRALFALPLFLLPGLAAAEEPGLELVMFDQAGCIYCTRWTAEVGDAYDDSAEGRAAPLRRIDISEAAGSGLTLDGAVVFTPTFVLVRGGVEISRLEGYAGEDFFWGLLGRMIEDAGVPLDTAG